MKIPSLIEILILCFCLWQGRSVVHTWDDHPMMYLSTLAFFIWIIPVFFYWMFGDVKEHEKNWLYLIFAIIASTAGTLGSLNALKYIGLSLAIVGMTPQSWCGLVWWISSASWMPAMAYFLHNITFSQMTISRTVIVFVGTLSSCLYTFYTRPEK